MTVEADIIYGRTDALAMTYDLLKPTAEANGATVIFMVSGGWVSRWFDPRLAMMPEIRGISLLHDLLKAGYHIVMLRHGSSPRYKVPDAADHVEEAIQHLRENAGDRGLDPERIGSVGEPGGHLSLYLATLGVKRLPLSSAFAKERRRRDRSSRNPDRRGGRLVPSGRTGRIRGAQRAVSRDGLRSGGGRAGLAVRHVDAGDAPVLLLHGTEDTVVTIRASEAMKEAYDEASLEAEYHRFEGGPHVRRRGRPAILRARQGVVRSLVAGERARRGRPAGDSKGRKRLMSDASTALAGRSALRTLNLVLVTFCVSTLVAATVTLIAMIWGPSTATPGEDRSRPSVSCSSRRCSG